MYQVVTTNPLYPKFTSKKIAFIFYALATYILHLTTDKCSHPFISNCTYKKRDRVRKRAYIRNRYNQAPHLTQDTNGKVTTTQ